MKYVSLDLESTGRNRYAHQIIEFGVVIDDLKNPRPVDQLPALTGYVNHKGRDDGLVWEMGALLMFQDRLEEYNKAEKVEAEDLAARILGFITPFFIPNYAKVTQSPEFNLQAEQAKLQITFAGKQFASFDKGFLYMLDNSDALINTMHYRSLDPGSMYARPDDDVIPSTAECMKRAKIGGAVMHRALDDARNVVKLIRAKHNLPY